MPKIIRTKGWLDYKRAIADYSKLSAARRERIIFRGHADSRWALKTTIDRRCKFSSQAKRQAVVESLVQAFKESSVGVLESTLGIELDEEWELLGRHHGLPTPILDWTQSPYMAAYFAFDQATVRKAGYVSIWTLDREVFESSDVEAVDFIDSKGLVRFNPRAVEQRAIFMRVVNATKSLEQLLGSALVRYDVPVQESQTALADLDAMNVNARVLFRNLDGVARLADRRVLLFGEN